jgi:aminoglycoside phosphotransferase (APT) family kinase protein
VNIKKNFVLDLSDRTKSFYWQTNRKITLDQLKTVFVDRFAAVSEADARQAVEYAMRVSGKKAADAKVISIGKPIPRGSINSVMPATLADGTEIIVRIHPYRVVNGYFWSEKAASGKARDAGVPCYRTYHIDDSQDKFPFSFIIMEKLPGKTLQDFWPLSPELDRKLTRETGRHLAAIHSIHPEAYGFFDNKIARREGRLIGIHKSFSGHMQAGFEEDLEFLIKHEVLTKDQAKASEKAFNNHEDLLSCPTPSLIHNDIADWNELSDGEKITGVIDWDECFSGDPVMDFAQYSLFFPDSRLSWLLEGYREAGEIPEGYEEKLPLFRLRYAVSKLHLRKKKALILPDSKFINGQVARGMEVLKEELKRF